MPAPLRTTDELIAVLHGAFPPPDPEVAMRIEHLDDTTIRMRAPVGDRPLRPGDTLSGPTLFSIADAVAWMLTLAHLDHGHDAVTSAVTMQFLRRPQPVDIVGEGRLLRMGRRLSVSDVLLFSDGLGDPVAQATVTYAPIEHGVGRDVGGSGGGGASRQ
jgi:uncharacterized protein (TIGR00369 family)